MSASASRSGQSGVVLVADDHPDLLELACLVVEDAGYTTLRASNGVDALRLIREQAPDACVLDVMMPSMNGLEVLEAMRSSQATRAIPVLLLTASVADADGVVAGELRAELMRKPFDPDELTRRIRELIGA